MSSLVELQLVSLIWACKYNAKLWVYHSWRRWWATYLSSDSQLDPCTLYENVNSRFLFLLFFLQALLQRTGETANTHKDRPLHGSNRIISGCEANHSFQCPTVTQSLVYVYSKLKAVERCTAASCVHAERLQGGFFCPAVQSRTCAFVFFSTLSWKKCRWIEAAKCVSWSPCWKSWEEAGLAGGGNENVRWPASIQLYKLMVSMKCQSELLNQERATRLVVLQWPPLPPLLLDGNLLKAENTWWGTTGQTQWG